MRRSTPDLHGFIMFDHGLDEWYIIVIDSNNVLYAEQFFGYSTERQAQGDISACIRRVRAHNARVG